MSVSTLADLLEKDTLSWTDRSMLGKSLHFPWCWPEQRDLEARALALGFHRPQPLGPGWSLLVSVGGEKNGRRVLWALGPENPGVADEPTPFGNTAAAVLEDAGLLATKHIPVLWSPAPLESRARFKAWFVFHSGAAGRDELLEGLSFGLAMLLVAASLLLDTPLPSDLCALAAIHPDGRVDPVGCLAEKLEALTRFALGVRRVIVAPAQREEALRIIARLPRNLDVVDIAGENSLSQAVRTAFPDIEQRLLPPEDHDVDLATIADKLFRLIIEGTPLLLGWKCVHVAAERVRERLGPDDFLGEARFKADFAAHVAARHEGIPALMPWPSDERLAAMARPVRLAAISHILQSAADAIGEKEREYVHRAVRHVAEPGEEHREDLKLLGAAGRALAAVGDYSRAADFLFRSVEGWFRVYQGQESSYALSEYLRVLGILRHKDQILIAMGDWVPRFEREPGRDKTSLAFVRLSAGRALVQAGDAESALRQLCDNAPGVDWELTPDHLKLSRLRWLARAQHALGRTEDADVSRRMLREKAAAAGGETGEVYRLLAGFDECLERDEDPCVWLDVLPALKDDGHEFVRLVRPGLSPREQARVFAEEYRY